MTHTQLKELIRELNENKNDTEPVLRPTIIAGVVGAVTTVVAMFGLQLTETQSYSLAGLAIFVTSVIGAWRARSKAWSPKTVYEMINKLEDDEPELT